MSHLDEGLLFFDFLDRRLGVLSEWPIAKLGGVTIIPNEGRRADEGYDDNKGNDEAEAGFHLGSDASEGWVSRPEILNG